MLNLEGMKNSSAAALCVSDEVQIPSRIYLMFVEFVGKYFGKSQINLSMKMLALFTSLLVTFWYILSHT